MRTTRIGIVLDSSGSMGSIKNQAIEAFNEQLRVMREKQDDDEIVRVTLVLAGAEEAPVYTVLDNKDPILTEVLTDETYKPYGSTPLYDGMGRCINQMLVHAEEGDNFLLTVISDGKENASREWNGNALKLKIEELEETGVWTFTYIGANQDLFAVSQNLSVPMGNTFKFESTPAGTQSMSTSAGNALRGYMSRGSSVSCSTNFFEEEEQNPKVFGEDTYKMPEKKEEKTK